MGLLDLVLGQVLGGAQQQAPAGGLGGLGGLGNLGGLGPLAGALGGLLASNGAQGGLGGLGGLVEKFSQAGLGDVIGSWIGKGENAAVSGEQLHAALGGDALSGIAGKLGISVAALMPLLVTMLPTLIDKLTPNGQLAVTPEGEAPAHDDLLASLSSLLQKG